VPLRDIPARDIRFIFSIAFDFTKRRPPRERRLLPPWAPRHRVPTVREILDETIAQKLVW